MADQHSPLLELPAEIRLQIYAYVTTADFTGYPLKERTHGEKASTARNSGPPKLEYFAKIRSSFVNRYAGLLLTCRQIYNEAHLEPFKVITLVGRPHYITQMKQKMKAEQIGAIRSLRVLATIKDPPELDVDDEDSDGDDPEFFNPFEGGHHLDVLLTGLSGLRRLYISIKNDDEEWQDWGEFRCFWLRNDLKFAKSIATDEIHKWATESGAQNFEFKVRTHCPKDA